MQTPDKTIDRSTLRRLVDAGAQVGAEGVGGAGGWGVVISYGQAIQTLVATRGAPRTWRHFDAGRLPEGARHRPVPRQHGPVRARRLGGQACRQTQRDGLRAHEGAHHAAAHDSWFREQVQASINDPRASVYDAVAKKDLAAKRAASAKRAGAADKGQKKAAH